MNQSTLDHYNEIIEKRNFKESEFIKHIMLISSSLFGIIVAFHKSMSCSDNIRILYSIALILISCGIIFLSLVLYKSVDAAKKESKFLFKELVNKYEDPYYQPKTKFFHVPKKYNTFQWIGYVSLILSLITLTAYSILVY